MEAWQFVGLHAWRLGGWWGRHSLAGVVDGQGRQTCYVVLLSELLLGEEEVVAVVEKGLWHWGAEKSTHDAKNGCEIGMEFC